MSRGGPTRKYRSIVFNDEGYREIVASPPDLRTSLQGTSGKEQRASAAPAQVRLRLSDGVEYAYAGKLQFSERPALAGTGPVTVRAVGPA